MAFELFTDPAIAAQISAVLTDVAIAVGIAAIGFLSRAVHGFINANKNNKQYDFLVKVATIAVQAAEQVYEAGEGDSKQAYAIEYVKTELKNRNIPIDVDQIITALEAAVLSEFNYPQSVIPADPPTETVVEVSPGPAAETEG